MYNTKNTKWCIISILFVMSLIVFLSNTTTSSAAWHRGIWLSYVDFEEAGLYNRTEDDFINKSEEIFSLLESYKINNIYFHVRAFDDAIYPGSSFKWCEYLSPVPLEYDALSILIDAAHRHKISFHAWINPYRISSEDIYNPAKTQTTEHIVTGIREIIENYDVDGIHFDDYFYPSIQDDKPFCNVSVKKRMENVNKMIRSVYKTIKDYDDSIVFGISPSGNTGYAKSIGCDINTWLSKKGYIDYIIPQLYWSDNYRFGKNKVNYYTQTLKEWTQLNKKNVPMYIGLALYKAGTKRDEDPGWIKSNHNLADQTQALRQYHCKGEVLFSYKYLFTPEGKKETANYIKYISDFKTKLNRITLKKGRRCNISKYFSIKKAYRVAFTYSSSNKKVAAISNTGIIYARKKGLTRITVKGLARSKISFIIKVTSR